MQPWPQIGASSMPSLASLYNRAKGAAHLHTTCAPHVDNSLKLKLIWLLSRGAITLGEATIAADCTYGTVRSWLNFRRIDHKSARKEHIERMIALAQEWNDERD